MCKPDHTRLELTTVWTCCQTSRSENNKQLTDKSVRFGNLHTYNFNLLLCNSLISQHVYTPVLFTLLQLYITPTYKINTSNKTDHRYLYITTNQHTHTHTHTLQVYELIQVWRTKGVVIKIQQKVSSSSRCRTLQQNKNVNARVDFPLYSVHWWVLN